MAGEGYNIKNRDRSRIFPATFKTYEGSVRFSDQPKLTRYDRVTIVDVENSTDSISFSSFSTSESSELPLCEKAAAERREFLSSIGKNRRFTRKKARFQLTYHRPKSFTKNKHCYRSGPHAEEPVRRTIDTTLLSGSPEHFSRRNMITEEEMYRQLDMLSRECVDLSRSRNKNVDGIPFLICLIMVAIAVLMVYFFIAEYGYPQTRRHKYSGGPRYRGSQFVLDD